MIKVLLGVEPMELKRYFEFILGTIDIQKYRILIINSLTIIGSILSGIVVSRISKNIIDKVFVEKNLSELGIIIPVYVGTYLVNLFIDIAVTLLLTKWKIYIDYQLKNKFYQRVSGSKYAEIEDKSTTDIYYRMFDDGAYVSGYVYVLFIIIPSNLICALIMFPTLYIWSKELTLYTLLLIIGEFSALVFMRKPIQQISSRQKNIDQHIARFIMEKLEYIDHAKVQNFRNWWINLTHGEFEKASKITYHNQVMNTFLNKCIGFYRELWMIGFLILGGYLSVNKICTVGTFISFQTLINYLMIPLTSLFEGYFLFQQTKISFKRYMEYYDLESESTGDKRFKFENCIKVQKVSYSYLNGEDVLYDISFKIKKNLLVYIKGESGSGKTTLLKIFSRLYQPSRGRILIDGVDINEININSFRGNVNFMLQNTVLFEGSLRDNICLGTSINDKELLEIIKRCHLQDVVERLPDKLDSIVGKGKVQFSKGEVQRISLARVLVRKPSIIWLDEPTASLDEDTENAIIKTILEVKNSFNILVIVNSHSRRLLQFADEVIELKKLEEI